MMWSKDSLNALEEAAKEAMRTFLAGFVTTLTSILTMIDVKVGVIAINWNIIFALLLASAVTALYRGIEKFLYENNSTNRLTTFLKFEGKSE